MPALAYALAPNLYDIHEYRIRIATPDELTRGQMVADVANRWPRPPNARVLMGVQAAALADMFTICGSAIRRRALFHNPIATSAAAPYAR